GALAGSPASADAHRADATVACVATAAPGLPADTDTRTGDATASTPAPAHVDAAPVDGTHEAGESGTRTAAVPPHRRRDRPVAVPDAPRAGGRPHPRYRSQGPPAA